MPLHDALLYILIGFAAGMLSVSFGVGGGALSTPSIRAMGISAIYAIGTTLPSILPGVITGMYGYRGRKLVRYDVVSIVAPTGVIAAILGSYYSHKIPGNGHLLMIITAAILMINAIRLSKSGTGKRTNGKCKSRSELAPIDASASVLSKMPAQVETTPKTSIAVRVQPQQTVTLTLKSMSLLSATGVIAGLISGMLGLGGGIALVPILANKLKLPLRQATATSLVCIGVLAIPSIITHSFIGDINWPVATLLTAGTVPGAKTGTMVALKVSDNWLRISAALVLSLIALVYGISELRALTG